MVMQESYGGNYVLMLNDWVFLKFYFEWFDVVCNCIVEQKVYIFIILMYLGNLLLCRNFFNKNNVSLFKQVFLNYVYEYLFDKF